MKILDEVSLHIGIHYKFILHLTREFKKAYPYLARCVGHVAESHSQLVITKVRTEHVIVPHICTKGVIPIA